MGGGRSDDIRRRALIRRIRDLRLRFRGHAMFPPLLICDRKTAERRFRDALARARASYLEIRDSFPLPKGFVHPAWEENIREVESYFLDHFDMTFLNHPRINGTMVFTDRSAHSAEWSFLKTWRPADTLRQCLAGGMNAPFLAGRQRTATLINSAHHLYHIAQFETFRRETVEGIGTVVEFGGGYGNLARIFRNLGHAGGYVIIDLPLFCCIQYVYLATLFGSDAVRILSGPGEGVFDDAIRLVPISILERIRLEGDLFISTWALSESPSAAYDLTLRRNWYGAREILLGFHEAWKPWDMDELVGSLKTRFGRVAVEPIPFLPGSYYLFATGQPGAEGLGG